MRNIKVLGVLVFFMLAFSISALAQNVTVNPGAGSYPTLKDAFDAINAGTHTGAVTVDIVNNTTETAPAVLNSSGAGAASYTSVMIRPINDGVTVSGAIATGRGLIELNGADNVTIDGDNPNTGGISRNLTVANVAANTITFDSVIRIALNTTTVTSADNDTFKNLNIFGNGTGRNIAAATSTAGTENNSYGIYASASASAPTTAPTAIASLTTVIATGATASNLTIQNNNITTCGRAVAIQGSAATVFPGLLIENNTIGNPAAGAVDGVYSMGVTAQGTNNGIIRGNTVYIEGFVATGLRGLEWGSISATGTTALFEKNQVLRVRNNNTGTFGAYGINLNGGNTHTVQNNFVADIRNDQTAGTGAFSTTFGAFGIRVAVGTGHKIYHNSVHLFGAMPGIVSTNLTAPITVVATTLTGVDIRNNIFSNQITGGNPTGTRNVAINLPSGGTAAMNLTENNNGYFVSSDAQARLAQVGVTFGTGEFTVAAFNPGSTTPATNFRSYSSTLSAAGTNDNASFAVTGTPPFVSNTDLHIPNATVTPIESGGANIGVAQDIDMQARTVATPDIGADEFTGVPQDITPPAISYTAFANTLSTANRTVSVTISDATGVASGALLPRIYFRKNGGSYFSTQCVMTGGTAQNGTYDCTINYALVGGIAGGDVIDYFVIAQDTASPANIASNPSGAVATDVNNVTTPPAAPNTYTIAGAAFPASVNVGTGETYTSLTNAGGVFQALNGGVLTGNVVVNITTNLPGELGTVALNQLTEEGGAPGTYTVTFKPSGGARTVSGSNANGIIKLNGADRITFDGSLSGGTDRSLTVTATANTGTIFWITSASATNGALNDTIKNCIISGNTFSGTIGGILTGSGSVLGNDADSPNNGTTIVNNQIFRMQNAMYLRGAASLDQNYQVRDNSLGSTVAADKLSFRGMLVGNLQNFTVSNNFIQGVVSTATSTATMQGIQAALSISNGLIERNNISDIKQINTAGWGSAGILMSVSTTASNTTISNNFIRDVASAGFAGATSVDNGYGIVINTGGGFKLYFNSVKLDTNQTAAGSITAALLVETTATTVGSLDVRNNIFANQQTVGTRYGVYNSSPAAATVFSNIDYNDYFAQNVGFQTSARVNLAAWQTATGQDANSKEVDPLFVSATDLHIQAASPMVSMASSAVTIYNDFDNELRDNIPDIGADEIINAPRTGIIPAGTFSNGNLGGSTLGGNIAFTGNLTLSGIVNGGGNTLTLGCGAAILGASSTNYFVGPLHKDFCAPGSFTFPVGDLPPLRQQRQLGGPGYTPLTANVTAVGLIPSSLTVTSLNASLLGLDPTKSLDRNWSVIEAGNLTADITFTYLSGDVNGNEADYRVFRRGQVTGNMTNLCPGAPCVNTGTDTAGPATGLTEFGRFTAGENLAPVAASINISGRVTTASGVTGIPKTRVTISGNTISQPRTVLTSPFGYYNFDDLPVGTYILTVESKQYTFSVPTRVINAEDNITGADFISNE